MKQEASSWPAKWYRYLETLGDIVRYYDIDSTIFTQIPGETKLQTGDFLGNLTDEVLDYEPGLFIDAFSIRVPGENKVKGISFNYKNSQF